jgi:hypothetical protein
MTEPHQADRIRAGRSRGVPARRSVEPAWEDIDEEDGGTRARRRCSPGGAHTDADDDRPVPWGVRVAAIVSASLALWALVITLVLQLF